MSGMILNKIFLTLIVTGLIRQKCCTNGSTDLQKDISEQMNKNSATFLSRKRRYLMFPAGSSFQLVFCFTYTSEGGSDFVVFGHTAALAFELPSKRLYFDHRDFEEKKEEPAETTTTEMPVTELPELDHRDHERIGNDLSSWNIPYNGLDKEMYGDFANVQIEHPSINSKPISPYNNPFMDFVQNSGYSYLPYHENNYLENNRIIENLDPKRVEDYSKSANSHRYSTQNSHMVMNMEPKYYNIHRRTRRDVYKRIENFLTRVNLDGKSCVLKAICEVTKSAPEKETFIDEVFKAIFRSKPHERFEDEDEYDDAANPEHNCTAMYTTCQGSIRNVRLQTQWWSSAGS